MVQRGKRYHSVQVIQSIYGSGCDSKVEKQWQTWNLHWSSVCASHIIDSWTNVLGWKFRGSDLDFIKSMVFVSPCFLCFSLSSASEDACENTPVNLLGLHRKAAFYEKQIGPKGASHCAHLGPASGPRNVPSGREILGVLVSPLKTPWVPLVLGSSVYLLDCIQGGELLKTNIYCILMIYNLHITYNLYLIYLYAARIRFK